MRKFGLIGFPLTHSFSKKYFTAKFEQLGLADHFYDLFEMESVDEFVKLWEDPELVGVNVTVPHKQNVMPFLDGLDASAERVGAVNVIKRQQEGLIGYNSDYVGFKRSLEKFIGENHPVKNAIILGTGGASKAVEVALADLHIEYQLVSRRATANTISYDQLNECKEKMQEVQLIVNTTPLGTYPKVDTCPDLPYSELSDKHYLYDLVYNPSETLFLQKGKAKGAQIMNGAEMLERQAERSWEIWNQ
ncbi:shikimate dehydrogenase [Marinoscillum sp. MHG1-6]|uniref:shikimate dehydrogenase family protein n=1 Tax=Marinoscillum sp. MHG1-6 TaxID=2959627 RepID=UPI0021588BCD|nr:shikimate dehydrogenase [Marinoscillum sp. MHG1-6]